MITARDFYNMAGDSFKLTIAAGRAGLNRPAVWLYLAEDASSFSFIRGGELAITTGMSISPNSSLKNFIAALIDKNTSGLIINTGRYITESDITPEIKAMCDENDFLLMTMPWEIHLSDIMQSFADLHFSNRLKEDNMKNAITELFRSSENIPKHSEFLLAHSLMPHNSYAAGIIDIADSTGERLFTHSLITNVKGVYFTDSRPVLVLFHNTDRAELEQTAQLILSCAEETGTKIRLATGSLCTGWESLCHSFAAAEKALKIAEYKDLPYFGYENAGIYSLFMHVEGETAYAFAMSQLAPLAEYDRAHGAELIKTLAAYIKCKGSLKTTAECTACHRNTVAYRIGKIKQLLNTDLDDGGNLSTLYAAAAAFEYAQAVK